MHTMPTRATDSSPSTLSCGHVPRFPHPSPAADPLSVPGSAMLPQAINPPPLPPNPRSPPLTFPTGLHLLDRLYVEMLKSSSVSQRQTAGGRTCSSV